MISLIADTQAKRYTLFYTLFYMQLAIPSRTCVYKCQKETGKKMFWILHEFGNNY